MICDLLLIPTTCAALAVSAIGLGLHVKAAVFAPCPPLAVGWEVEIVYIINVVAAMRVGPPCLGTRSYVMLVI